jgi:Undecaprenyl-phosphate galactose phosphotransferase WbaP
MEKISLNQLTDILSDKKAANVKSSNIQRRKLTASLILLTSDILTLSFSFAVALLIRDVFWHGDVVLDTYLPLLPVLIFLFPLAYFIRGLYPGFGMDIVEELRTLTYSTTAVYAVLATMTFLVKDTWDYSRLAFVLSWIMSLITVPLGRSFIKNKLADKEWWGIPVLIIGAGQTGERVIQSLQKHYQIGLKPFIAVDDDADKWGYINDIPVIGGLDVIEKLAEHFQLEQAIIAMPSVERRRKREIIKQYSGFFENTTYIPDLFGISSLWVNTKDIGGILGLEVQEKLLKRSSQIQKRFLDIALASFLMLVLSPLFIILAILIKLDSKGKIFFYQERMGKNDSRFKIIKFRTMFEDAETRLNELLNENEEYRSEYEVYHKLRTDPRLTRVGKFLRKFSLDELPQFINVLKGDMSLIGPRAYLPWEKVKMNGYEEMILKVKPGISGLWQVTDRNESSFEERNETDVYYIRNWSMFLDIYIVARTISVVVLGRGAY